MDPPGRSHKRRVTSVQTVHALVPGNFTPAGSPCPSNSNPKSTLGGTETRRSLSAKTISVGWSDGDGSTSRSSSRLQIEAECVETKTVTTTTTTKRSYPPILLRHRPLQNLNEKEYPLSLKPTPPELNHFSYEVNGQLVTFYEGSSSNRFDEVCQFHFFLPRASVVANCSPRRL
jgi:F-box and WD-40 domain protein CDC4